MLQAIWVLTLGVAVVLGPFGACRAAERPQGHLEELQYRVDLGGWQDVARVHLRLIQMEPGRYRAEFAGAAQGAWKVLSRWLPERYETEMALEAGRFKPLVFREEFRCKGRHISKEYRFDHSRGVLELWRGKDGRKPVKDWQGPLKETVSDPLTLFYNLRLGAMGPLLPGQTLKVSVISDPDPLEMVINLGPETAPGRKVMLTVRSKDGAAEYGPYFLFCTPQGVPQTAWMRVLGFAKLSGELLNPGEIRKRGFPGGPDLSLQKGAIP
jgi:hypothetical protein